MTPRASPFRGRAPDVITHTNADPNPHRRGVETPMRNKKHRSSHALRCPLPLRPASLVVYSMLHSNVVAFVCVNPADGMAFHPRPGCVNYAQWRHMSPASRLRHVRHVPHPSARERHRHVESSSICISIFLGFEFRHSPTNRLYFLYSAGASVDVFYWRDQGYVKASCRPYPARYRVSVRLFFQRMP